MLAANLFKIQFLNEWAIQILVRVPLDVIRLITFLTKMPFVGAIIFGMLAMVTKPSGTVITTTAPAPQPVAEDPTAKLTEAKQLLDSGVITQEEFDEMKKKYL